METREPWEVARDAARLLRVGAAAIAAIVKTRGDEGGTLATLVRQQRETADAMVPIAARLRPPPALVAWNRGQAEAEKYCHAMTPGKPS